jgi:hypothetical protein
MTTTARPRNKQGWIKIPCRIPAPQLTSRNVDMPARRVWQLCRRCFAPSSRSRCHYLRAGHYLWAGRADGHILVDLEATCQKHLHGGCSAGRSQLQRKSINERNKLTSYSGSSPSGIRNHSRKTFWKFLYGEGSQINLPFNRKIVAVKL